MRINYTLFGVETSGGVLAIFEISNNLLKRGHDVSITIPDARGGVYKFHGPFMTPKTSAMKRLAFKAVRRLWSREALFDMRMGDLESAIPDCDINVATFCLTAFPVYRSGKGKPYYHMQHYEPLIFDDKRLSRIAEETYKLPLNRIANSTWLRNIIMEKTGVEPPVTNHALDHTKFYPRGDTQRSDKKRVLAFGKEAVWKGTPDLLEAMELVFKERSDVELVLFGSREVSYTRTGVPYTFMKDISDEELAKLYSSADVVACPSWYESFPLPPLEAMACGAPVVTTRLGTEDYAFDGETALVVPPRDPKAMAAAIMRLLEDEPLREHLKKQGPKKAKEFTWDRTVDGVERIFREGMK